MSLSSTPRLRRLQVDFQSLQDRFSGHSHVSIASAGTHTAPERYEVEFRLRGLVLDGDQPVHRDIHTVELTLPRDYPRARPHCIPLEPIFHPNISDHFDCFCRPGSWSVGISLADVVAALER